MATVAAAKRGADADLVVRTLAVHGRSLLATAQRHSLCPDDAADAYQRALEIFLRHAERLDPSDAHKWLHTVVKHEAITLRAERQRVLPRHVHDFVRAEARHEPSPDDSVLEVDQVARAAEALTQLKPAEAQALWLKAKGRTYAQIAGDLGWTRTKVNRCLAEGRARLRAGMETIELGEECARWEPVLAAIADGSAGATELTAARRHLRNCPGCRAGVRALHEQRGSRLTAFFPAGLILAGLHERAVGGVVRAQAMLDALTNGKAAAVAASAAAIAGGSISVVDRALEPDRTGQVQVRAAARTDTPSHGATRAPDPAASPVDGAPAQPAMPVAADGAEHPPVAAAPATAGSPGAEEFGPGRVADDDAASTPVATSTAADDEPSAPGTAEPVATAATPEVVEPSSGAAPRDRDPGFLP